jgi:phage terminase large subunit
MQYNPDQKTFHQTSAEADMFSPESIHRKAAELKKKDPVLYRWAEKEVQSSPEFQEEIRRVAGDILMKIARGEEVKPYVPPARGVWGRIAQAVMTTLVL